MATKTVWIGRENSFIFGLEAKRYGENFESVALGMVTKMRLELRQADIVKHNILVQRNETGDPALDWWDSELTEGSVLFRMGLWAASNSVEPGRYDVRLTVYDDEHPDGIVWASFAKAELEIRFYE